MGNGGKKTVKWYLKSEQTNTQTDRQTDISTYTKHRPRGPMLWKGPFLYIVQRGQRKGGGRVRAYSKSFEETLCGLGLKNDWLLYVSVGFKTPLPQNFWNWSEPHRPHATIYGKCQQQKTAFRRSFPLVNKSSLSMNYTRWLTDPV